jgi:RND superfamily putative drug exporter
VRDEHGEETEEARRRRRARGSLLAALALVVLLGGLGTGVESSLEPTSLSVPGSASARGETLLRAHFGNSAPFAVLLRGPADALNRQGPALVAALRRDPRVTTLSPWDKGALDRLRPAPGRALVLVDFHVGAGPAVKETVARLDRLLGSAIRPPVRARQTGYATLSRAIQQESVEATHHAELIAIPFLLLVLLLVFRSPVAAAIPILFGAAVVLVSRGGLFLAASFFHVDGFSLTVASMMGLALGVDYTLLLVSRFREEVAAGSDPWVAARRTRATAGHTAAFAGSTLILAMAVTLWVMPGSLFLSLAGTAILVTAVSVALAVLVAPPLLYLLGDRLDRWRIGGGGTGVVMAFVVAALRRPRLVAGTVGLALVLLALPVLGLRTGPPSVAQLPTSSPAREDAEAIDRAIGAGWEAPFVLVAATERGPITTSARLAALSRAQRAIARDPAVQAVVGPAQLRSQTRPLTRGAKKLIAEEGDADPARLEKLGRKLDAAAARVGQLRAGLARAAAGAGLLAGGSARAREGADRIAQGLDRAAGGSSRAVGALRRLDDGSGRIAAGARRIALGSRSLDGELAGLLPVLRRGGLARARRLRSQLRTQAASDPALAASAAEADRLVEALALARNQAKRAHATASRLRAGQATLAEASGRLHRGAGRLATAAAGLPQGLARLGEGAGRLAAGLAALRGGAASLSTHLDRGHGASDPLQRGLADAGVRVSGSGERLSRRLAALRRRSPGIFDSGYFVLSALQGAPRAEAEKAGQLTDLDHGGQAAQMLVVPRYTFNTPGSAALNRRLQARAARLANATGFRTGVAGGSAQLEDYSDAVSSRISLVVLAISLITFLVLVVLLRALALAAIAVALNLLTVAVAFGVLTLLLDVPAGWPLGGHEYVDSIGAAGIFGIVFGLSIDYAVFLLARMRESHDAGAANADAIAHGLQRTARVITGAAAVMVAVFAAFAGAPIATVSQLGVGLTVAVVLDATVVRIVLLPALMLILGERVWWLPRPLERILPKVELHGA